MVGNGHPDKDLRSVWNSFYSSTRDIWDPPVSVPETNGKSLAWSENLRLTPWFHDPNVGFPVKFPVNQFDV
jgi:hypothetical protein